MNIAAIIISSISVLLSGYALYRTRAKPDAAVTPDASPKGMGGGGR